MLSLTAAGAMVMALMPAGIASAEHAPNARDTDNICESDNPNDYDSSFADVGSGPHWVNIVCMADEGITEGVAPDGTNYAPRREVTRGQMASFIVRFIEDYTDEEMPEGDPQRFDDVPETDSQYVHATNIHKLAEADIVQGTAASDGQEYAPQANVNRMQMGTFIRHALSWIDDGEARNASAPPEATHDWFPDPSAPVHEANVDAIAEAGDPDGNSAIVEGFRDGTYGPTESVLRDQMASYVMRAYDYAIEADLGPDPAPEPEPLSVSITEPTQEDPAIVEGDGDFDVVFESSLDADYTIELEHADEDEDVTLTGEADEGTNTVNVDLDDAADGAYDLTVTVEADDETDSATEAQAVWVVADAEGAFVANLTQGTVAYTITEAVDEAEEADALLAFGTFVEQVDVHVDWVTLHGAPGATIDVPEGTGGGETLVTLSGDGVEFAGFTTTDDNPGEWPTHVDITGDDVIVAGNDLSRTFADEDDAEANSGNPLIHIADVEGAVVEDNGLAGGPIGGTSDDAEILDNTIVGATDEGIWLSVSGEAALLIDGNSVDEADLNDSGSQELKLTSVPASINGVETDTGEEAADELFATNPGIDSVEVPDGETHERDNG
jgi:hypothetical protein